MNGGIRLRGMVLSAFPIGEYDRRLLILTAERGKITAFARGARRPKSAMIAATNPFVLAVFDLYEGKDAYTAVGADVENYYESLTQDLELVWYGYYFLEMAEYFSLENNNESERLALLESTFHALMAGRVPISLVRNIYEFKTLVLNGDQPNAFFCLGCGKKEGLSFFSMDQRSVVCNECEEKIPSMPLPSAVLKALQYISLTPAKKLYSFLLSEEAGGAFALLVRDYYRRYVTHHFKSEDFLDL